QNVGGSDPDRASRGRVSRATLSAACAVGRPAARLRLLRLPCTAGNTRPRSAACRTVGRSPDLLPLATQHDLATTARRCWNSAPASAPVCALKSPTTRILQDFLQFLTT